jgi:hypothetical protein
MFRRRMPLWVRETQARASDIQTRWPTHGCVKTDCPCGVRTRLFVQTSGASSAISFLF